MLPVGKVFGQKWEVRPIHGLVHVQENKELQVLQPL